MVLRGQNICKEKTMEEKNELNDIILNKGGASSGSKKLLLAIATLTLILIIVLVIMNSLKNEDVQHAPQAVLPPEPSAPSEIINDPLFEPVEVIQEGNESGSSQDLNQVAQKIKQESLQETPIATPVTKPVSTVTAPVQATPEKIIQSAPVAPKPVKVYTQQVDVKPAPKAPIAKPAVIKQEAKKVVEQKPTAPKTLNKAASAEVTKAPEVKAETKVEAKPVSTPVAASTQNYYVQVGSFTKEPNKALFDRLNASGMKYTTQKSGEVTKILVGPFQGEKATQDGLNNIRQNIEAKAFRIKG